MKKYILVDGRIIEEPNLMKWAEWFGTIENRVIEVTEFEDGRVSTIFLGIDHSYGGGPPVLFESMVFGGEMDQEQRRYCTLGEAKRGHFELLDLVRKEAKAS